MGATTSDVNSPVAVVAGTDGRCECDFTDSAAISERTVVVIKTRGLDSEAKTCSTVFESTKGLVPKTEVVKTPLAIFEGIVVFIVMSGG